MADKYITKTIVFNGDVAVLPANDIKDIEIELPKDFQTVEGIAFYETKNAANLNYQMRVADKSVTHQDFCSRFDFLSLLNGSTYLVANPKERYKNYGIRCQGNTLTLGFKLIPGVAAGQKIEIDVVIKCVN